MGKQQKAKDGDAGAKAASGGRSARAVAFEAPLTTVLRAGAGPASVDPGGKPAFPGSKADGKAALLAADDRLDDLQERLYAQAVGGGGTEKVLLILQAMDTAGKGGIIRHVIGSVDPQGVRLHAFKAPTDAELRHDFLWRVKRQLPVPGTIGVFDRSHYEDVLVGRVRQLASPEEIERRYGAITAFEEELAEAGTRIIKVMLHISRDEQYARLAERLDRADKYWKFNPGDIDEREHWDDYMEAYRIAIERTDADHAPWFIVPADRKWYARLAVQHLLLETLARIDPQWPAATFDVAKQKKRLAATR
jgi:PPK2 family polyphosphate:nucleotide phosphotransferase